MVYISISGKMAGARARVDSGVCIVSTSLDDRFPLFSSRHRRFRSIEAATWAPFFVTV